MRLTAATWAVWAVVLAVTAGGLSWLAGHHRTLSQAPDTSAQALATPVILDVTGGRHWHDPSVPPEILAKAFAAPPTDLPLAARPVRPNITPPERAVPRTQQVR